MSSRMCVTFLFGLQLKRPSQKNRILFFYPKKKKKDLALKIFIATKKKNKNINVLSPQCYNEGNDPS